MIRLIVTAALLAVPVSLQAETLFASKSGDFASKLGVLDSRAASQYAGSARLQPKIKEGPERTSAAPVKIVSRTSYRGTYLAPAKQAAARHGVPEGIFLNLVARESAWNPKAVSHRGAIGLAQLMPGTARLLRVDPTDPIQNLEGGARYLAQQYRKFGNWRLALAAYNAGPGAVERHGGVPPYAETTAYVAAILGN